MDLFGQDVSTLEITIRGKLEDVEADLQKLLREDTNSPIMEEEEEQFVDPQELEDQVQLYRAKIAFLKQASLARTALDESKTLSSATLSPNGVDLVQASKLLVQALELIRQAESFTQTASSSAEDTENFKKLISSMKHEIRRHRVHLISRAGQTLDSCVQMTHHSLLVKNAQQLDQAYQVLEEMEGGQSALKESLWRLSTHLYDTVLKPILAPHQKLGTPMKTWKITESEDTPKSGLVGISANKGPVYRLQWTILEERGEDSKSSAIEAWKETFKILTEILVFAQSKILMNRQKPSKLLGDYLFGDPEALPSNLNLHALGLKSRRIGNDKGIMLEDMMERLGKTCIPDSLESNQESTFLTDLAANLKDVVIPFCNAMCQNHLITMSPKPKLMVFCDTLEDNYIQHRRCILLNQAREILVNNDYHNTIKVGVEASLEDNEVSSGMEVFQSKSSSISDTANKLMELVRKTMDEAVAAGKSSSCLPLLRPTLYKTAREIMSLFRSIVPASHKKEVNEVPRTAAVLHNDCIFLAHNCLTLGLEYKEQFITDTEEDKTGKLLSQSCIFVDMVPLFRELADESMGDMLELQKQQLLDLVKPRIQYLGESLKSEESLHEWSEAETALAAAIYHLKHLDQAWSPILAKDVFQISMEYMANVVFTLFTNQLLSNRTLIVSGSGKQFISALFANALKEIGEIVVQQEDSNEWDRFLAVQKFLEMTSIGEVQAGLTKGLFQNVASQELQRLIQGTFGIRFGESLEYKKLMNALSTFE